jgi:hypothetical protein
VRALCMVSARPEVELEVLLTAMAADAFSAPDSEHAVQLTQHAQAGPAGSGSPAGAPAVVTDFKNPAVWCTDSRFAACIDEADDALVCIDQFPPVVDARGSAPAREPISSQEMLSRLLYVAGQAATELNVLVDGQEVRDRTLANQLLLRLQAGTAAQQGEAERPGKRVKVSAGGGKGGSMTDADAATAGDDADEEAAVETKRGGKGGRGGKAPATKGKAKAKAPVKRKGKPVDSEEEEEADDSDEEEEDEEEPEDDDDEAGPGKKRKAPSRPPAKGKAAGATSQGKRGSIRKQPDAPEEKPSIAQPGAAAAAAAAAPAEDDQSVQDRQQQQAEMDSERANRIDRVRANLTKSGSMMIALLGVIDSIVRGSSKTATHKIREVSTQDKTIRTIDLVPGVYSHTLLSSAALALSRVMSVSPAACTIGMPLLVNLIERKNSPILQCHAILGLCDIVSCLRCALFAVSTSLFHMFLTTAPPLPPCSPRPPL